MPFTHAPPAMTVDGLLAVPIDVQLTTAAAVFDLGDARASVDATMEFVMGATAGCPVFDLRQPIQQAFINGASIPPGDLDHHDMGGGPGTEMRIIDQVLAAGSHNTLGLVYELGPPQAGGSEVELREATPTRPVLPGPRARAGVTPWAAAARTTRFDPGRRVVLPAVLRARETVQLGLEARVPAGAKPGDVIDLDVLQRDADGVIIGGVSLRINVVPRSGAPGVDR